MSIILSLLTFLNFSHAQSESTCPYLVERKDGTQIQQMWSSSSESCFFSVGPLDAYVDLVYRDYLLTSEGMFMVFNSYGEGDESRTTAAREFFAFPRVAAKQGFRHEWNHEAGELIVHGATGDRYIFESKKAHLKSIDRAQVKVADYVDPSNRGGVEITNFQGLLLDGGFALGRAPTSRPSSTSTFIDRNGRKCVVTNREIFKYTSDGDVLLRYDDPSLKKFMKTKCPNLETF